MKPNEHQEYRKLIKKYNIHFEHGIDSSKWPGEAVSKIFSDIVSLGKTVYETYHSAITFESATKPWRAQTKRRAGYIASRAKDCLELGKNETTWRLDLESEVLARFSVEVACRKCRGRLWRSEIETRIKSLDQFGQSLDECRARREPCSCDLPPERFTDTLSQGISRIFDDNAENTIQHDEPLRSELPKGEKPDRIFGLRSTRRLDRLLSNNEDKRPHKRGQLLEQSIRSSPYNPHVESPHFPFLILEAKSGKSQSDLNNIELQTAFTIRLLLKLQYDLREAAGSDSRWASGPLVWFVANRGEHWHIAAAYTQKQNGEVHYRIVDLWDGRIVSKDDALQLLLILDYICDWARDSYREAIVGELRALAATDSSSLADDSEIFSIADLSNRFWAADTAIASNSTGEVAQENTSQLPKKIRRFDCEEGVVRHAKKIQYRFQGLYIDSDNIQTLLQSLDTPAKSQRAARDLLRLMKDSWRVKLETLDALEYMWTGHLPENGNLYLTERECCTKLSLCAYMTPGWEQVLELAFVAISQDALTLLLKQANLQRGGLVAISDLPFIDRDNLMGFFQCARQGPVISTFQAAVKKSCLTSSLGREKDNPGRYFITSIEPVERGMGYRLDALMIPDKNAQVREIALAFYYRHKIGMREPQESFLRISSKNAEQRPKIAASIWPCERLSGLDTAKAVLLSSHSASFEKTSGQLCLYLLDDSIYDGTTLVEHLPTAVPLLSRCQDRRPSGTERWNLDVAEDDDTASSDLINKFRAHIESEIQSPSGKEPEKSPVAQEGTIQDQSTPPQQKRRKPDWTILAEVDDPDQAFREYEDILVARKRNCDSVTWLSALPRHARSNAVRAKVSPYKPVTESRLQGKSTKQIREEGLADQVVGISAIIQRGDQMILADPARPGHRHDFTRPPFAEQEPVHEERAISFFGDWPEDNIFDGLPKSGGIEKLHQTGRHQQAEEPGHPNQDQSPRSPSTKENPTGGYQPCLIEGELPTKPKSGPEANLSAQQYHGPESCNSKEKSQSQHQKQAQSALAPGPSSRRVPVSNTTTGRLPKRQRAQQEIEPGESSKRRKVQSPALQIMRDHLDDEEFQYLLEQGAFGVAED